MEHILENLPSEVHWNIIKFLRHPSAEIVKESTKHKYMYYQSVSKHGDAFDRGKADAYYMRSNDRPHKVVDRVRDNRGRYYDVRVEEEDLTEEEREAYLIGYLITVRKGYHKN